MNDNPFAKGAPIWRAQGWLGTIQLPYGKKSPPPTGFTGHDGIDPDEDMVAQWAAEGGNIGIRLPMGVIGIDVDWYKPEGQVSWTNLVNECGALPATWKSSGRPQLPHSGVYLFRIPWEIKLHDKPSPGIEIIQWFHRYICTWPSIHPEGEKYLLTDPAGRMGFPPPLIDEVPMLPETWLKRLILPELPAGVAKPKTVTGTWSRAVSAVYAETNIALNRQGGRHDSMRDGINGLMRLAYSGHPGATEAMDHLSNQFVAAVTSDGTRNHAEAYAELQRILDGARELIGSTASYRPSWEQLGTPRNAVPGAVPGSPEPVPAGDAYSRALDRFRTNHHRGNALNEVQPLTPIVEGLLDLGTLAVVLGEPGSGKSQVVMDLSAHVVLGRAWCDRPTRQGTVVYFVGEGQYGIRSRVAAWAELHDHLDEPDEDQLLRAPREVPIDWVTVSPNLLDLQIDTLAALEFVSEIQPCLVVIDTLNRALPGGDENSPQDMGKIIMFAERVREICGATTLYVHHLGKDATRGARGHSSLNGAADTVLLVKPTEGSLRQVHLEKQKDHPDDYDLWFRSHPAAGSIGVVYEPQTPAKPDPDVVTLAELAVLRLLIIVLKGQATAGEWKQTCVEHELAPNVRALDRPLNKLTRLGLASREGFGPKITYTATEAGRRAVEIAQT